MKLEEVLKTLKELESKSLRQGYRGDATSYAFKRLTLMMLNEMVQLLKKVKKPRKTTAWNLFLGDYLRRGKSIKEAAEDWKKKKEAINGKE